MDEWPVACRVCGTMCEVFSPEFRRSLAAMQYGRYAEIAKRLGTKVLVTSDKNFNNYWLEDPLFRFDLIVLFKPLKSQIWSALKKRARDGEAVGGSEAEDYVRGLLDRWARDYSMLLRFIRPKGQKIVLNWNAFTLAPAAHMAALVDKLNLPGNGDVLEKIRVQHTIGGNTGVDFDKIRNNGRVVVQAAENPVLDEAIIDVILAHTEASYIERVLKNRYRQVFGNLASEAV